MSIVEIYGGPITHRYLMRKTKDELAYMYLELLRDTERAEKDAARYRKIRDCDAIDDRKLHISDYVELRSGVDLDLTVDAMISAQGASGGVS